ASMSGSIERGSIVFTRNVPVTALAVGDVITYIPPASSGITHLVTHRISAIELNDSSMVFSTKGDANASADPWAFTLDAADQARVDFAVPGLGFVFIALADPSTRMLALGIPAGLVALFCVAEIVVVVRSRSSERASLGGGLSAPSAAVAVS
ncbi:signal peptidase I, partial [Aphanothece microscopica]|uniref:signal peptidase I n=1 Tax=Aphanothece microscopica TaxID=1049561 RepID=UPI00398498DF